MVHPVIFSEAIAKELRLTSEGNVMGNFVRDYCYRKERGLGLDCPINTLQYFPDRVIRNLLRRLS